MDTKEIQKKLEESEKKAQEYLSGWQRARADLLNYKKEEMERIGEFLKYANEEFILKILPVLDSFDVAEKKINEENPEGKQASYGASIKGMLQIKTQLQDLLKAQGLEEIKSLGEKFDPNFHEIIGEVSPSEASAKEGEKLESGIIVEEVQKGYQLNGRVVRPAKVKISK